MSMLFPPIDPNERFRERRAKVRRRKRLRQSGAVGATLVAVVSTPAVSVETATRMWPRLICQPKVIAGRVIACLPRRACRSVRASPQRR